MQEQITRCDICNEIIGEPDAHGMVSHFGSQVWTTPTGEKDACAGCLSILQIAAGLGMIEIPMAQFYKRAGFTQNEQGHWERPSGETIYNVENMMAEMGAKIAQEENQE